MNTTSSSEGSRLQQASIRQAEATTAHSGWEVLPNELLCNILGRLPFCDLVSCQRLSRRTAEVIRDNLLLFQAYCQPISKSALEEHFSTDAYDRETRSWLLEAGRDEQLLWLDSMRSHSNFAKVLFFVVSETMKRAGYWNTQEKLQIRLDRAALRLEPFQGSHFQFSPDRQVLVFIDGSWILRIMTIGPGSIPTESCHFSLNVDQLDSVCFAPNSNALAAVTPDTVYIVEKKQNSWTEKYQNECSPPHSERYKVSATFSSDGRRFLVGWHLGAVRVLKKANNEWVTDSEFNLPYRINNALFLLGHSFLGITSCEKGFVIADSVSQKIVVLNPQWSCCHGVSSCGRSLAVGTSSKLCAIATFITGEWRTFPIPPEQSSVKQLQFSPDGQHLAFVCRGYELSKYVDDVICVMHFDGTKWQEKGHTKGTIMPRSIQFSPDSRSFFAPTYHNGTVYGTFNSGYWQLHNTCWARSIIVEPMLFSPDSQTLLGWRHGIRKKNMTLARYKAGRWSAVHRVIRPVTSSVLFSPSNRHILIARKDVIELLEIKPKNNGGSY